MELFGYNIHYDGENFFSYNLYVSSHPWKNRSSKENWEKLTTEEALWSIRKQEDEILLKQENIRKRQEQESKKDPTPTNEGWAIKDGEDFYLCRQTKDGRFMMTIIWVYNNEPKAVDLGISKEEPSLDKMRNGFQGFLEEGNPEEEVYIPDINNLKNFNL